MKGKILVAFFLVGALSYYQVTMSVSSKQSRAAPDELAEHTLNNGEREGAGSSLRRLTPLTAREIQLS